LVGRFAKRHRLLHLGHIRHFAVFIWVFTADFAVANFVGQHGVIAGASTTKLIARYQMPDIDQQKGCAKYGEDYGKEGKETVHDGLLWWGKDKVYSGTKGENSKLR
jgi:hypothetical protein